MSETLAVGTFKSTLVAIDKLKKHPRNYRVHPDDQLDHLGQSLKEHGVYRNVVVANDLTILAGHGVVQAAERIGIEKLPVIKLAIGPDDPKALKILTGDNELPRLAEIDDRALVSLLQEISDNDLEGLLGTGFDQQMLANLVYVTRPRSEIQTLDEAAHWVGLPDYEALERATKLVIMFDTEDDRTAFLAEIGANVISQKNGGTWSLRWPLRTEPGDPSAVKFDDE